MAVKPMCGKLQEFRNRLDIPVGVNGIDVTKIGCKLRQFPFDIEPRAIPVDESSSCEAVAKILEARPTTASVFVAGGRRPMARESVANVLRVELGVKRWPRSETRKASVTRRRSSRSRCFA